MTKLTNSALAFLGQLPLQTRHLHDEGGFSVQGIRTGRILYGLHGIYLELETLRPSISGKKKILFGGSWNDCSAKVTKPSGPFEDDDRAAFAAPSFIPRVEQRFQCRHQYRAEMKRWQLAWLTTGPRGIA